MRRLIVNGDDFGYSDGVSRGILEAHERGILTSTSLIVDAPAAERAVELARRAPGLGIGLHAVLDRDGELTVSPEGCEDELERQLRRFDELTGAPPTHLDSHHHVHRDPRLEPAFLRFANRHELPLRDHAAPHCGLFYGRWDGQRHLEQVSVEKLLAILDGLDDGVSELGCHPGYADGLASSYTVEREHELRTLTDPRVHGHVAELGIQLIGWAELT